MANCTNCGFELDPEVAVESCPRCGTPVRRPAPVGPPAALALSPDGPPAFDSTASPEHTLFGLPSPAAAGPAEEPHSAPPGIPTPPPDAAYGGLDAPISEFDFPEDADKLQLDVLGGFGDAEELVDLPAPAAPRPRPPRAPAPVPTLEPTAASDPDPDSDSDSDSGFGAEELDLPAPVGPSSRPRSASGPPPLKRELADLPAPEGLVDLPAPVHRKAPPPSGADLVDLPAPVGRETGSGVHNLDLPAPRDRDRRSPRAPKAPPPIAGIPELEDVDLPTPVSTPSGGSAGGRAPGGEFDLPRPVDGADLLSPVDLDLPISAELDLPQPSAGAGLEPVEHRLTPAGGAVAPAELDLEPSRTGVAPAETSVESREGGMLAPKGPSKPAEALAHAEPAGESPWAAASPRSTPSAGAGRGSSRKRVYAAAAVALAVAVGGGLYAVGLFSGDGESPPSRGVVHRGSSHDTPKLADVPEVVERSAEVLAALDLDAPSAYARAARLADAGNDPLGGAEARLLLHLRYGPDAEGVRWAEAALKPFAGSSDPVALRVLALAELANGNFEAAAAKLSGEGPRTTVYRALLLQRQGRSAEALAAANEARARAELALATHVALDAQRETDPDAALGALRTAVNKASASPNPGLTELLAEVALEQGALKTAASAALKIPPDASLPVSFRARTEALKGRVFAAQGDTTAAMAAFDRALELAPRSAVVLEAKVRAGIAGDAFAPALEAMQALRMIKPDAPDVRWLEVKLLVASGKGDEALARLDVLAKEAPDRIELPFYRGEVQAMRLQVEDAQVEFAKVIEKDPQYYQVALAQADMFEAARRPADALEALDAGVARLAESTPPTATSELLTAKARLQLRQRRPDEALAALDAALAAAPADHAARVLRGTVRIASGDLAAGEADLVAVYERAGGYPGLVAPLGKIFAARGELDKLEELVGSRAEDAHASDAVKLVAARLRLAQGRPRDAKRLADEVLSRSSGAWEAQLVMAEACLDGGELSEALQRIDAVRPPTPRAEVFVLKGKILEFNSRHDQARTEYRRALTIEPMHVEARFLYGRLLAYQGKAKPALEALQAVVAETDAYPRAYLNIGRSQRDLGRNDAALVSLAKALALDPTVLEAHYLIGRVHLERNKTVQAVAAFKSAVAEAPEGEPWLPDAWLFLGRAEEKSGRRAAAKRAYEAFLEIAPVSHSSRTAVERTLKSL